MRNVPSYFIILAVSLIMAACGGHRPASDDVVIKPVNGVAGSGLDVSDVSTSGLDGDGLFDTFELENSEDSEITDYFLNQRVIYFGYDSSLLTPKNEAIVRAHARYLKTIPEIQIVLEGHTDERGTREYNLALGENRANAVSRVMQVLGICSDRIQSISYGEEKPASWGSTKNDWRLNRRVEILYP